MTTSVIGEILKGGKRVPFYTSVQPMLATLVEKAFDKEGWTYEVKWDGYRAIAFINKEIVELRSRNDKSFNEKYYSLFETLKKWKVNAIVDGEIVVVNKKGASQFNALQNWRSEADGQLLYYLFDILWYEGVDLKGLPLSDRKVILKSIIPENSSIKLSADFDTSGIEFLETARKMGLEGIVAKKLSSPYTLGKRTTDWLKIKANKRQEVVIGGYTINEGSHKPFSSLLVGFYEGKNLIYTGRIGTGWNTKTQLAMMAEFNKYRINNPPFSQAPDVNQPSRFRPNPPHAEAYWLKPELVCEVSYTELTPDGVMRHPSFEGMRPDKKAKNVVLEKEEQVEEVTKGSKVKKGKKAEKIESEPIKNIIQPFGNTERRTLLNPNEKTQVKEINGRQIKFSNLDKLYWPDEKIAKRDLINYYYKMAQFILPYIENRPMTLKRYPDGITGFYFYQKDVTGKVPAWVKTCNYFSETEQVDKKYLLANDEETLLLMASLGSIEMHPWNSTVLKPDYPTWCIIDLDPDKNSFDQVIEAAQVTKQILDDFQIPSVCKTSGSTGLHIYIPLGAKYTYEQCKEFGRVIATMVHNELPDFTSIERKTVNREGKIYIDFLQNRPHATVAAPYSLRPRSGAPVSMPLHWHEVKKGLSIMDFNLFNAYERATSEGDLFLPILGKGINLDEVISKFKD